MPHMVPVGIYLGFKIWMYYTWLIHVAPHVSSLHTMCIMAASAPIWYTYLKCWLSDPGVIQISTSEKFSTLVNIIEGKG